MTIIPQRSADGLEGRVAFVPGGTGGIGTAVCTALATAGAKVVAADLQPGGTAAATAPGMAGHAGR
ncbi:MAG: hypothetical protein JWO26_451, partial [Rhodospirillales bacterium]|nr:hypothetical protein [Rhodospirillales bacterium]